jgi:hypothetical protein
MQTTEGHIPGIEDSELDADLWPLFFALQFFDRDDFLTVYCD